MGNISYIVPVENKQDLKKETITKMIADAFPEFDVELHEVGQIIITDKNGDTVCEMWEEDEGCYLLEESDEENEAYRDEYEKVRKLNLNPDEMCIGVSIRERGYNSSRSSRILTFLVDHFKGYWFDEGIHPEFITYTDEFLNKYR